MNIVWANPRTLQSDAQVIGSEPFSVSVSGEGFSGGGFVIGSTITIPAPQTAHKSRCGNCGGWFFFQSTSCTVDHGGACCHKYDIATEAPPRRQRIAKVLSDLSDSEFAKALFR